MGRRPPAAHLEMGGECRKKGDFGVRRAHRRVVARYEGRHSYSAARSPGRIPHFSSDFASTRTISVVTSESGDIFFAAGEQQLWVDCGRFHR